MKYREIGELFTKSINQMLDKLKLNVAFVIGGGYAYNSTKYTDNKMGDFDFMIVYKNENDIDLLISELKNLDFCFENKYLELDKKLLDEKEIDIIRLNGTFKNIKSTINLVPFYLIKKIAKLEKDIIIKKIAHNRNTSLFFAYGSNDTRITVNFISPSFITDDNEDHYIHLDFSLIEKNNNIYFGILADAILKGFNANYDNIGFIDIRKAMIKNIHNFFEQNEIESDNYLKLYSNNVYFPNDLKKKLQMEFNNLGKIKNNEQHSLLIDNQPIIFTSTMKNKYEKKPFNFINNKSYKCTFNEYILKMQETEYDRQYLIDALGKFLGYINTLNTGKKNIETSVLDSLKVYGTNDLYFDEIQNYFAESIVTKIIEEMLDDKGKFNNVLQQEYIKICMSFLSIISNVPIKEIYNKFNVNYYNYNSLQVKNKKINIEIIKQLNNFNEIGTYHNYISKVMPEYTKKESDFLESIFTDKNKKILDVMCGYGRIANVLKSKNYNNIDGIDEEDYNYLHIPKDFHFIKADFLKYHFTNKYDYLYCLYNCYSSNKHLKETLTKLEKITNKNATLVFDVFNRTWRESIDKDFFKILYEDDLYKIVIVRDYNKSLGIETTKYIIYSQGETIKEFVFSQKFFYNNELEIIVDKNAWDIILSNSLKVQSRNNEQKHILILRRK